MAADTFDDLMGQVALLLVDTGNHITPSKGGAVEVWGATLELHNPVARVSRTETRGKFFSALGEFCWYLSGSNDGDQIAHYIPNYPNVGTDGTVESAYGPRLFGADTQIRRVCDLLSENNDSRRAVASLYQPSDHSAPQPPCTCVLQFLVRDNALQLIAYMRSNDLYIGFPHDVFAFTMIQELVARYLSLPVGLYTHIVGSLHVYDSNEPSLNTYLAEGWQTSDSRMPAMPDGDPWPCVERFLEAEALVRNGHYDEAVSLDLPHYWSDLVRLLAAWWLVKKSDLTDREQRCISLRDGLHWRSYTWYIDELLAARGGRP